MPYRRVKPDAPRDRWGHVAGDPHHNFLRSRQWQKIRAAFLGHHPLCEHCELLGRATLATQADHIERLVDSDHFKRTSWEGLQALCAEHHSAQEQLGARVSPTAAAASAPIPMATLSSSSAASSRRPNASPS